MSLDRHADVSVVSQVSQEQYPDFHPGDDGRPGTSFSCHYHDSTTGGEHSPLGRPCEATVLFEESGVGGGTGKDSVFSDLPITGVFE